MDPEVSPDKLALLKQVLWVLAAWQPGRWDCRRRLYTWVHTKNIHAVWSPTIFVTPLLEKSQYPLAHAKNRHPADNGHHQIFAEPADEHRKNRAHKVRIGN